MKKTLISISRNVLSIFGFFCLIFLAYIGVRFVKKEKEIAKIYKKCHQIKIGMSIGEVYQILDNKIYPEQIIKLDRDSVHYTHYLRYPAMLDYEYHLSIEVDPAETKVLNVIGCDETKND